MDFYESFVEPTQTFVTSHGWSLLFGSIVGWLVWKLASPRVHGWRKEREDREWEEAVYGNPEEVARRQEALARARARQQEEYEKKAKAHAEKMKEREEQQRAEAVSEWDKHREGRGYRSKVKPSASQEAIADRAATELTTAPSGGNETCSRPPRRLRPEYNPLMGQGASRFTPAPRGNFSGG